MSLMIFQASLVRHEAALRCPGLNIATRHPDIFVRCFPTLIPAISVRLHSDVPRGG